MKYPTSVLRLRVDILVALFLLLVAKAGQDGEPNSDVCYYLGDRYWRLADYYSDQGSEKKAQRFRNKAESNLRASGYWNGGPYGGALAMPIPKRPTFTAAIGARPRHGPPDDAA